MIFEEQNGKIKFQEIFLILRFHSLHNGDNPLRNPLFVLMAIKLTQFALNEIFRSKKY